GALVTQIGVSRDLVRLLFNESIQPSSFTAADVTARSNGKGLPVADVSPVPGSNDRAFDVIFQKPATAGLGITLGWGILDTAGTRLNQDGDGSNGEANDGYTWQDFLGPRVLANSLAPGRIRLQFDQTVDPSSFTVADVKLTDLKDRLVKVYDV